VSDSEREDVIVGIVWVRALVALHTEYWSPGPDSRREWGRRSPRC
jgi:hypothetical protein